MEVFWNIIKKFNEIGDFFGSLFEYIGIIFVVLFVAWVVVGVLRSGYKKDTVSGREVKRTNFTKLH